MDEYQNSQYKSELFRGLVNQARKVVTNPKNRTVLGRAVTKLPSGNYILVAAKNRNLTDDPTYIFYESQLDQKIGQGNTTQGRIFKGSDGTWRFADGTVVTKFKSPAAAKKTTPQTASEATSSDVKAQGASSSNTQGKVQSTATRKNQRGTVNTSSTTQEVSKPSTFSFNGKTYEGFSMIPINHNTQPQKSAPTEQPQQSWDEYINQPIVENTPNSINYDTNYIRGFRGQGQQGYRDVNSYLTWLGNNKNSDDYKLFMQNGYFNTTGDDLDYGQISQMLASQGIRGNLGRRDSRRLGNVLTRLRNQSTAGTPENAQFLQGVVSSYNQNKNSYVNPGAGKVANNAILGEDGQIQFLDNSGQVTLNPYSVVESSKPSWLDRATQIATRHLAQPLPIRMGNIMTSVYGRKGFNSGANA